MIAQLEKAIKDSDQLSVGKRAELRGVISTRPGLNRYLQVTPGGLLRTDAAKTKAEENIDGTYLLRTADPKLSAEDIAVGYKQLLEVARISENACGQTWPELRRELDKIHADTFTGPAPRSQNPSSPSSRPWKSAPRPVSTS